jgi:diacylglycerol O-acyltransferase
VDRLSLLDASFLFGEDGNSRMDIAFVLVFAGPPASRADLVEAVAARLPLIPRYRQKVRLVPWGAGLPVWVDDRDFDLDRHVLDSPVPAPGGPAQMCTVVADRMSRLMDRSRPLWELHRLTGLTDDRWAVVVRMHHAMVDGLASIEIIRTILTETPQAAAPVPDTWQPAAEPSDPQLVIDALAEGMDASYEAMRQWATAARAGAAAPPAAPVPGYDIEPVLALGPPVTDPTFNGPVGPARRWALTEVRLDDVNAIRAELGGTVNDVVLVLCARGFRELLKGRGQPVEGRVLRSLVPVSVRAPAGAGQSGNQLSAMVVELPVGDLAVTDCLGGIRRQTETFKRLHAALPATELVSSPGFASPVLLSLGSRLAGMMPAYIHTITSNVPGPQTPLFLCGRQMLQTSACMPLWSPLRVAVAILSYFGSLTFGVVGDRDTLPDIDVFDTGVAAGLAELQAAVGGR